MYLRRSEKFQNYVLELLVIFQYFLHGSWSQLLCNDRIPQIGEVNSTYISMATAELPCNFVYTLDLSTLNLSQILVSQIRYQ